MVDWNLKDSASVFNCFSNLLFKIKDEIEEFQSITPKPASSISPPMSTNIS